MSTTLTLSQKQDRQARCRWFWGFVVKTRQQILESLRTPNTDLVDDAVVIDFLRSRDEAEQARFQFLMNPVVLELSEQEQEAKDAATLAKLGFVDGK